MNVNSLLDKAKISCSASTDAELAKALGVSKQALSGWRNGVRMPDTVTCATLAGLTGEPLAKVLGIVGEARAISREEKTVWRKLAASAVALFMVLVTTALPGIGTGEAQAQPRAQESASQADQVDIMRTAANVIGDVWRWLRWRFGRKPSGPETFEAYA